MLSPFLPAIQKEIGHVTQITYSLCHSVHGIEQILAKALQPNTRCRHQVSDGYRSHSQEAAEDLTDVVVLLSLFGHIFASESRSGGQSAPQLWEVGVVLHESPQIYAETCNTSILQLDLFIYSLLL